MPLSLKNPAVETLAREVAEMTGETMTEAVRRALAERKERLALSAPGSRPLDRGEDFLRYLADEVWPRAPRGQLGRRLTREEEEVLLGFGREGA